MTTAAVGAPTLDTSKWTSWLGFKNTISASPLPWCPPALKNASFVLTTLWVRNSISPWTHSRRGRSRINVGWMVNLSLGQRHLSLGLIGHHPPSSLPTTCRGRVRECGGRPTSGAEAVDGMTFATCLTGLDYAASAPRMTAYKMKPGMRTAKVGCRARVNDR